MLKKFDLLGINSSGKVSDHKLRNFSSCAGTGTEKDALIGITTKV